MGQAVWAVRLPISDMRGIPTMSVVLRLLEATRLVQNLRLDTSAATTRSRLLCSNASGFPFP